MRGGGQSEGGEGDNEKEEKKEGASFCSRLLETGKPAVFGENEPSLVETRVCKWAVGQQQHLG